MPHLRFEWDPAKAVSNPRKQAVSFEEAASAFSDEHALVIEDPDHPGDEERFVLLGLSAKLRMPVLVHCYRERDEVIRLISARKAKPQESRHYSAGPS